MRFLTPALLLFALGTLSAEEWKPLFNGKDFSGWETYLSKPSASAQVEGLQRDAKGEFVAVLGVNRDPFHAFSYVQVEGQPALRIAGDIPGGIATLESYSNYHLRLQFKWGELHLGQKATQLRNSGILYHGHGQHGEGNGRWLPSHQFQVQNGFCGDYIAMGDGAALIRAKRAEEKRYVYNADSPDVIFSNTAPDPARCGTASTAENPLDRWNTLDLYCVGDDVVHVVNSRIVLRAKSRVRSTTGGLLPLTSGRIEIQAEGWEIYFRNLEIAPLAALPAELK